jgi:ankyrin repeat protein
MLLIWHFQFKKGGKMQGINEKLLLASETGNWKMVKILLNAGAGVNIRDEEYLRTPLFWAVCYNHKKVVKLLLKAGADVNTKDIINATPLMYACWNGNEEMVKLLLNAGANINIKDIYGDTALDYALNSPFKNEKIIKLLKAE